MQAEEHGCDTRKVREAGGELLCRRYRCCIGACVLCAVTIRCYYLAIMGQGALKGWLIKLATSWLLFSDNSCLHNLVSFTLSGEVSDAWMQMQTPIQTIYTPLPEVV